MGALVRPYLGDLCRFAHPDMGVNDGDWLHSGPAILVNARWIPPAEAWPVTSSPRVGFVGGQIAYVVLTQGQLRDCTVEAFSESLERWKQTLPHTPAGGWLIDFPWDLVERNGEMLCQDFPTAGRKPDPRLQSNGVMVIGAPEGLIVDPSATIEPMVVADVTRGPVVIDREAVVQAFSRLEGPCYIGPGSWVVGAKIRGSTIGPMCRVGGEIEASIVHGFSNKYHDGFLGHSYVGEWVNLASGTQSSDLRNDYGPVSVFLNGTKVDSQLTKVGSFIGDHSKTGLNACLNTGSVIGAFCNLISSGGYLPRAIPSFCRYYHGHIQARSDWREMLTTAAKVMQRRGQELTSLHTDLYNALFDLTAAQRRQILRDGDNRRLRQSM
jgi:UDP-N-acetylglucosamine diphosphorylase/glucosamine-1-phosphate N-acetyltransferase